MALLLPALSPGLMWNTSQLYTAGILRVVIAGDYNVNGTVDAADYIVWRNNEGTMTSLPNDNGIGGTIGQAHYNLWRSHFGDSRGSGAGAAAPEPSACVLVILAVVGISIRRHSAA